MHDIEQGFSNCGARTSTGTPATVNWYTGTLMIEAARTSETSVDIQLKKQNRKNKKKRTGVGNLFMLEGRINLAVIK
jgi:hypothetical protein